MAKRHDISSVHFIAQEKYQCGPASLAMIMRYRGLDVSVDDLTKKAFTSSKEGSFQVDMISAVRRSGLLAIKVHDLNNLIMELSTNNPVLVLQNLGLGWFPVWHYALVKGYDFEKEIFILHSGETANLKMELYPFVNTWKRSSHWGLIIVTPGSVPVTATEIEMVEATVQLEDQNFLKEALLSYQAVLSKWPRSFGGLMGLGNVYFTLKDFGLSCEVLKTATLNYPDSGIAWYNYSWALLANHNLADAKKAARTSLLHAHDLLPAHQSNLQEILEK